MSLDDKVVRGEKIEYKPYTKGLGEFYFENCDIQSENVFQIDPITDRKETYASIKQRSIRLAIHLKKLGVNSTHCVIICSKNTMDNCIPHFSAQFLGATTAGLHPTQSIREWTHCMKTVSPKLVFIEENCVQNMEKCLENLETKPELIVFGKSDKYKTFDDLQTQFEDEGTFRPAEVKNPQDTAVIMFSSGTTGAPKGMRISHFSVINKTILMMGPGPFKKNVTGLTYSTLYWISSILQLALCFYTGAAKMISPMQCDSKEMLEMIEKYKISFIFINPVILRPILSLNNIEKYDTSSLQFITLVGTGLNGNEMVQLRKIFKHTIISQAYGTSETLTSGTSFSFTDQHLLSKLESVGKVSPNCEIKIVNPESGTILGPNESGEIYIKSPFSFSGYCNIDSTDYLDKDGFFKTGDLGYYDEDKCFYIVGRLKETFKYRTYHIPPNYLEYILQEHPDVSEAGVFGIPHRTDGHLPAACLTLKENATTSVDDIEDFYTKNVSDWHKLRGGIKIVDSLPMTPTSKIQRNKLLELFLRR